MKKILVTGFDPFGGEVINPALEVIKQLPERISNVEIITLEVPTVFHKSAQVVEDCIKKEQPNAVLCIGQAGGRSAITLERIAINIDDARIADNEGNQPIDIIIRPDGATAYFSTLPIKAIVKAINESGVPAQVSNSAGTFVCNHLMYQVLYMSQQSVKPFTAGFMHIPYLPSQAIRSTNQPSMSLEDIKKAIMTTIEIISTLDGKKDLLMTGGTLC